MRRLRVSHGSFGSGGSRWVIAGLATMLVSLPSGLRAQARLESSGEVAEVARRGTAVVFEMPGPALAGRREIYRPTPPLRLRHRWVVVQDSTFAVVFASPSGVKAGLDSLEGDLFLRSLQNVTAVELRALVFNVWGDPTGYLSVTAVAERRSGETWAVQPRWRERTALREHRTSIVWVHRTMFEDESVIESDLEAVSAAWTHVTGRDFEGLPDEMLDRTDGP